MSSPTSNHRALDGLIVADFTRVLAGPVATMVLGDLGADVIKVERPGSGDDTRMWGPPWHGGTSTYYQGVNRNKRSIALDLADDADAELARRLATRADVLVENFRPGTMHRWGLGYDDVRDGNPGLVYCTISGFGSQGPGAAMPGYDLLVQATGGMMSINGQPGTPPTKMPIALFDKIAGLYAVTGILAALRVREESGRGQNLEVSLVDTGLASLLNVGSSHLLAGAVAEKMGNRHPSIAPYQSYRASDGDVVLAGGSEQIWARTCQVIDRPDLVDHPDFATNKDRVANIDRLETELEIALSTRTAGEWVVLFLAAGVPAAQVNSVAEAFAFADELERDLVVSTPMADGAAFLSTRSPIRLSDTPVDVRAAPPSLGEHDDELRAWLRADPADDN
ncbi:MAG: CoA transferase [Acidimicrobiia bacterium]|nr:CoA transferase [Acidimicrobiia bacterium]MDH3470311.1 CoA transferase [Acidimicrobiia bacterium]